MNNIADFEKIRLVVNLLEETTTLRVVSEFLKNKQVHHSAGSWDIMLKQRIIPAIESKQINFEDLVKLLSDSEESGKQHVFLYSLSAATATELLEPNRIESIVESLKLNELPRLLDKPDEPTISDVRLSSSEHGKSELIVKIVSQKSHRKTLSDDTKGNIQTIRFEHIPQRVVNLIKIYEDGFVEVRLQSQTGVSHNYQKELKSFWGLVNAFVPYESLNMYSLTKVKDKFWNSRKELSELIRYTSYTLKNDSGTCLRASAGGKDSSLMADVGANDSLDKFLNNDGFCDQSNIWFIEKEELLSTDIHVLIEGALNEFRLPKHCSKLDYDYVLSKIREFSI